MLVVLKSARGAEGVLQAVGDPERAQVFLSAAPPIVVVDDAPGVPSREALLQLEEVEAVLDPAPEHPLAGREVRPADHTVRIGDVVVGGPGIVVVAGPCSAETPEQIRLAAQRVLEGGAHLLRGGAFKPRTSPYSFQGHGARGLAMLAAAREATGLPVVTEVLSPADVTLVAEHADCLQVGARNMQNFPLLKELGRARRPVLLKRGFGCTVDELLHAAEYILAAGNPDVVFCERGIRTFETHTRFTFDLSAIAVLKQVSRLPVIADPSHAAGDRALIPALAKGAIAAGADGLMVEVHPTPEAALSDGPQALLPADFAALIDAVAPVAAAVGRHLAPRKSSPVLQPLEVSA